MIERDGKRLFRERGCSREIMSRESRLESCRFLQREGAGRRRRMVLRRDNKLTLRLTIHAGGVLSIVRIRSGSTRGRDISIDTKPRKLSRKMAIADSASDN